MPKFCPECGSQIKFENAKFCTDCGFNFQNNISTVSESGDTKVQQNVSFNIFQLGEKMEEAIEQIFIAKGYKTKRRQRIKGTSGTINEIDILAIKNRKKIAIECKNHSTPIGQNLIRDFYIKIKEIRIPNGFFASNSDFTSGAIKFAQQNNITLWSREEIMEEYWLVNVGRTNVGKEHNLKNALPLNIDYEEAIKLNLENYDKIRINSSNLFYKPYYVVEYVFKDEYHDPTREIHTFYDEGLVLIDGLDGRILNKTDTMGRLKQIISNSDEEVDTKVYDELLNYNKVENYRINSDFFNVNVMEPQVQNRFIKKLATNYITEKNTKEINYIPKSSETVFDGKSITYKPKSKNIMLKKVNFLYVPKWKIEFQSIDNYYSREIYGYTGTKIEDTIEYCPYHFQLGGLRLVTKATYAVCEVCGQALCNEHITQCPICGKWLCMKCGVKCSNCNRIFCMEHINNLCSISQKEICDECTSICPICGNMYSNKFEVECSECGSIVCKNCSQSKGMIIRKQFCVNCLSDK